MAKDYAKKGSRKEKVSSGGLRIKWFFVGSFFGFIAATFIFIYQQQVMQQIVSLRDQANKHPTKQVVKKKKSVKESVTHKRAPQFDFYDILPDGPAKSVKKNTPKHAAVKKKSIETKNKGNSNSYMIQVASMSTPEEADQLKAKLILAGYSTKVSKVVSNRRAWYRVMVGPYVDSKQAKRAQQAIRDQQHLDSLLLKIG